ncbi:MAG: hypothetical protein GY926_12930 [bacterium]|nr:hypothetical protein [bacterium]MCP4966124.1 hypothetical protein [bacterium]
MKLLRTRASPSSRYAYRPSWNSSPITGGLELPSIPSPSLHELWNTDKHRNLTLAATMLADSQIFV